MWVLPITLFHYRTAQVTEMMFGWNSDGNFIILFEVGTLALFAALADYWLRNLVPIARFIMIRIGTRGYQAIVLRHLLQLWLVIVLCNLMIALGMGAFSLVSYLTGSVIFLVGLIPFAVPDFNWAPYVSLGVVLLLRLGTAIL
ncbi:MAG: hypothetical protein LKI92_04740 [Schleiferilactobacillus harbinensis]|nr:hypothetical protein [Schleiferilactobacillus harbinensis]MCI1912528.1 hypothetical protein [Schleiferilactobacillus harbinensis]